MADIRTIVIRQEEPSNTIIIKQRPHVAQKIVINQGAKGDAGPQGPQGLQGPPGPGGSGAIDIAEVYTLTSGNISIKGFLLTYTPADPTAIELTPIGGILQRYGVDYVYSNGYVTWDGLGLDGFLEEGEQIYVRYGRG